MSICGQSKPEVKKQLEQTQRKQNIRKSEFIQERRNIFNDVFDTQNNNKNLITDQTQKSMVKDYNIKENNQIQRIDNLDQIDSKNNDKTNSNFIFSKQSINIVSIGGYIYNSLTKSYNNYNCKFIVVNTEANQITLQQEQTDEYNKLIREQLQFSFNQSDDVQNYNQILLDQFKNVLLKLPLLLRTEKIYEFKEITFENLYFDLKTSLLDTINKFLIEYSVDLDVEKFQFALVQMQKNYWIDHNTWGYIIWNYDFLQQISAESKQPEFYMPIKKIKLIRTWFSENMIEISKQGKPNILFLQDGQTEFMSKIWNQLTDKKVNVQNLDFDESRSRVLNKYNNDSEYYFKLDINRRKTQMIDKLKSLSRGIKMQFGKQFFFKYFSSFYLNHLIYNMIDKIAYKNPKMFSNGIENADKPHNNTALVKFNKKECMISQFIVKKHSTLLENMRELTSYAEKNLEMKKQELDTKRKLLEQQKHREEEIIKHESNRRQQELNSQKQLEQEVNSKKLIEDETDKVIVGEDNEISELQETTEDGLKRNVNSDDKDEVNQVENKE